MSGFANVAIHYHDVTMHVAYGGSESNSTKYAKVLSHNPGTYLLRYMQDAYCGDRLVQFTGVQGQKDKQRYPIPSLFHEEHCQQTCFVHCRLAIMKSAFFVVSAFVPAIAIARNGPRQEETLKSECVRAVSLDPHSWFTFHHLSNIL